ncbi:flavodoxin family protein [Bacillus lacus]|uniref:Flavodoxin family protein n=1 Tax=Metabacillus lacus TaxID=1983721 RepID=A0A7X2LXX2_9BACI|nr:flavodoxin family protein [Metabacillus lacus]MRX71168.1 flavodoxin family protein [Metabacillus lacus]
MVIKALALNCSLKKSNETSNTDALLSEVQSIFTDQGIELEKVRAADYQISFGMEEDMGDGDQWPELFEKVKEADILIIATPVWLGEKSSVSKLILERLDSCSSNTNEKGQSIYYNKVAGAVVTGNEDGAKHAAQSIIYSLSHLGFTIPPNADCYWVGEAGPGPSYIEANGNENEFTQSHVNYLGYNLSHFARMLKERPIPAEGNLM